MQHIKEGAIFVADAHYPHHGEGFITLLEKIVSNEMKPSQLFLMGDNFDLLFGYNDYIQTFSKEAIALLKQISKQIECFYFEGNHDFCLEEVFVDMHHFSRKNQPQIFKYGSLRIGLSHGDRYDTPKSYDVYCSLLRNPWMLRLLRPWQYRIIDSRMQKLSQKKICKPYKDFEAKTKRILAYYPNYVDYVIEGHFHQGVQTGKYVSLPSLACQNAYGVARGGKIVFESL